MANIFQLKGELKENGQTIWNLIQGWLFFLQYEVVVGITEESNSGRGSINNAELLYLHECGVPSHNIPARPVLKPAIGAENTKNKIETIMRDAALEALVYGNRQKAEQEFHKAGMIGRDACKAWITGGNLAPNAPSTIRKKGSSRPLIDTASMMNSITYAVRKKK